MIELKEIYSKLTGLRTLGAKQDEVLKVEVDNRCLNQKSLFIAIKGEKFNPMDHLQIVVDAGCKYVLFEEGCANIDEIEKYKNKINFLVVNNIQKSIAEIGKLVADRFRQNGGKILAISGSNGKTTTKEMVKFIADQLFGDEKSICTQKNNNNHLGVPFTLFQITNQTEFAVVELGSNAVGEIEFLCKILNPQFALTTNIGDTHLEFFGNRESVFKEEAVVAKYCSEIFFKNMDDTYLKDLSPNVKTISYGSDCGDNKHNASGRSVEVFGEVVENENLTGSHNFINLGVATLMLEEIFQLDKSRLLKAAREFKPTANRSQWVEFKGKHVFLDAYNANPSSMKVALEGFFDKIAPIEPKVTSCVVLGDMNELGSSAPQMHSELGAFVFKYDVHSYIFVGKFAKDYLKGCPKVNAVAVQTTEEGIKELSKLEKEVKYIFIKGSRSLQLERILDIK